MREILPIAADWVRAGAPFALATVVGVGGSAPREVGASMIVSETGELCGNVSGGCVEGAVYERGLEVIETGQAVLDRFGYSDSDALAVGLTCGGSVEVLVRPVLPGSRAAADLVLLAERDAAAQPTSYTLVVSGPRLGEGIIDRAAQDAASTVAQGAASTVTLHLGDPARLIIVGAVEFAVALARIGVATGMRVSVVDPRAVFATADRFPGADVHAEWPDRFLTAAQPDARTAVCVLSHDPKLDEPALAAALASSAGYVGAMGSRRTHDDRLARLRRAGVPDAALARLRSPIGLDLGGRTPDETALSILAEIIADRHDGTGARLSQRTGDLHARHTPGAEAPASSTSALVS